MSLSAEKFAIGIDIGATKIASVLLSEKGQIIASSQVLTLSSEGVQAVLDKVAKQIRTLAQQSPGDVAGVGIGSPGKVDTTRGLIYDAVNLGWTKVNLMQEISNRVDAHLPIWIQKDTNLSALGEYYFGAGCNCDDFVYVSIGSGLGGGIISDSHLITGGGGYAGELGHISIDPDGLLCICGNHGCVETIVSGPGLVRLTKRMLAESSTGSFLCDYDDLTPEDIVSMAQAGDELACHALSEVGRALGIVMSACAAILNPTRFIIGGGLGLAGFDFIVPAIREEIMQRTIPNSRGSLNIVRSNVKSPAVGPACLVWYMLSKVVEEQFGITYN
jgi:glucokinase